MKAVAIEAHGGTEQVKVLEVPTPQPGPGAVLIRVRAAALNRLDLFTIRGIKGLVLKMPHVVGSDAAGVIERLGANATKYAVGDRVTFNPGIYCGTCDQCRASEESECATYGIIGEHMPGSMAEFVVVPEKNLYKLPDSLSFESAAAASLVFQTAFRMLFTRGQARKGETVVVLGAGSGLSTACIQLAKHHGCRVIATTSSAEKMERARQIGADEVINYKTEDWGKRVWDLTGKRGADLIIDAVGRDTLNQSVRALKKGGRVVIPGGTSGQVVDLDLRYVYWKQVALLGSTMGSAAEFQAAMDLVAAGKVTPVVGAVFPHGRAREAFEAMESGAHFGKLVVTF